jgi:sigma-E factor negative regulatory protein RseA
MNQAGMNQNIPESLSAGIDGELSKEELRFLLRRLEHDASLQHTWDRYHVARDGLRRELSPLASPGFSEQVMLAIEQESRPAVTARRNHWLRWSAGGAIAASVAAAALMIAQPSGDAERMATAASRSQQARGSDMAELVPASKLPTAPAAVPPWLSGNSAGLLSQQASATLGETSFGSNTPLYSERMPTNQTMRGYRTLDNNDGTYLLLLDPVQQQGTVSTRRSAAIPQ